MAKKHVPFVIAYDFDGTLSPGNMQEYDFVPALGIKPADFWREAKAMAQEQQANDIAHWPALAVNYTTKTQYLFRINKGSLDVHDNSVINAFVEPAERPVPFSNMVFIGDGETDIPSMRLVKNQGGHSIAVYGKGKRGARNKALKLVEEGRTNLATTADYTDGSAIDHAIKAMIDKVIADRTIAEANG